MKTNDIIQLGALAAIGFLAYQKFAKAAPKGPPAPSLQPYIPTQDFGVNNPDDATWGETATEAGMSLQKVIEWAF